MNYCVETKIKLWHLDQNKYQKLFIAGELSPCDSNSWVRSSIRSPMQPVSPEIRTYSSELVEASPSPISSTKWTTATMNRKLFCVINERGPRPRKEIQYQNGRRRWNVVLMSAGYEVGLTPNLIGFMFRNIEHVSYLLWSTLLWCQQ
jgi:hypothetical protein